LSGGSYRKWLVVLAGTALLSVAYLAYPSASDSTGKRERVVTGNVTKGTIEEIVLALGTVEPSAMVRVGAQVTGQIKAIHVVVGQEVLQGDLLAEIDAVPQQNALRIARARVQDVKAQQRVKEIQIRHAEAALTRQRSLSERDAVSKTAFEDAEAKYQILSAELSSLRAQIEQSEVDLETAEANLQYTRITAPMSGTIVSVPVEVGQTLNAAQASPTVAVIADLREMLVKVRISEADVWRTKPGQSAWFSIMGDPHSRFDAHLQKIEFAPPSIGNEPAQNLNRDTSKDNAVYYNGVLRVRNPEGKLRTQMTAQVRISIGKAEGVLIVPWAALSSRNPDGSYTVKVDRRGEMPAEQRVRIGLTDKINAQVLGGLEEGDTVLLDTGMPAVGG
jgi:membrane fusion protein, macrolide-specific efflux system